MSEESTEFTNFPTGAEGVSLMDLDLDLDSPWPFDQVFFTNPKSPFLPSSSDQPCSPLLDFSDDGDDKPAGNSASTAGGSPRLFYNSRVVSLDTGIPDSVTGSPPRIGEKTWVPPPSLGLTRQNYPDWSCSIKERMTRALRYFKESTEQPVLAQVWVPVKKGDRCVLTTSGQPFVVDPHTIGLCQYRMVSLNYMFAVDEEDGGAFDLLGRVFQKKMPEWTPNVQYYSIKEYPRLSHALVHNVQGSLALPVFESSGESCVCVLELIMTSPKINYAPEVDKVCKALEAVNLKSSEILDHPTIQVRPLQQRNDGVVIHDDNDEQNVNLIPINEVQRLQDFGNELDQNVIHIHEETERIEAMARKGKATYVGEGNENSQGYSLEEGRHVEVNSLMAEKLYSGVQDIQLFQPSWPEVEIMQEDSSEQQILGELGPKNIGHKAVQKKEKGRSKKNIGHKVASAEKSCKNKNTTETPTRKNWTKRFISEEDLLQHVGRKRADAAKALGVSVSTLKRWCRKYKITCWNGDGCPRPRVEPELLNNSVHQSSPDCIPAELRGEKETSALLRAKQDCVIIKAKYGESILKFQLSLESGVRELNKEVAKRSLLELGSFNVEYLDEDEEWISIVCDEDFQACVEFFSRLSSTQVIRLLVKNKVSNSEKSHQSCSGLKTKSS